MEPRDVAGYGQCDVLCGNNRSRVTGEFRFQFHGLFAELEGSAGFDGNFRFVNRRGKERSLHIESRSGGNAEFAFKRGGFRLDRMNGIPGENQIAASGKLCGNGIFFCCIECQSAVGPDVVFADVLVISGPVEVVQRDA